MPSLSDSVSAQIAGKIPDAAEKTVQGGLKASKGVKKGVCLVFKGPALTLKVLMMAVKKFLDIQSSGVQYSASNISMKKLQKSGKVSAIDGELSEEIMKPLDKIFRKTGVKYMAMYNKETKEYLLFFSAKDTEVINACLKKAFAEWEANSKEMSKEKESEAKESVRNKIAFFRERVKEYNENRKKMKSKEQEEKNANSREQGGRT